MTLDKFPRGLKTEIKDIAKRYCMSHNRSKFGIYADKNGIIHANYLDTIPSNYAHTSYKSNSLGYAHILVETPCYTSQQDVIKWSLEEYKKIFLAKEAAA